MTNFSIDFVSQSRRFMRSVASIVLVTHLSLLISPVVHAAEQAQLQEAARVQAAELERGNVSKALGHARHELRVLADRSDVAGAHPTRAQKDAAKATLRAWREQNRALIAEARAEFAATGELVRSRNLPAEILRRHTEASAKFETEVTGFEQEVDHAVSATDETVEQGRAEAALQRLERGKLGRSQQAFDPNNLPNSVLKPDRARRPKLTPQEFQTALLLGDSHVQFAQAAPLDLSQLPSASNPAYLEASVEVVLTPDIRAKAAELNHNPVEIYNWVRNNVHWQPTWGAIQDASHTLSSRRGNAFDIASLTIALLRASGIPARYVYGTIDVPEDQFRNWAGGFENLDAALNFASAGGIPLGAVTSGGRISKVRLEHIWVEGAIDYHPSRGVKNRSADTWLAMDPSFKQIEEIGGVDALQIAGLDVQQLADAFLATGTVNQTESWASGMNPAVLQTAQAQARAALETYLDQNLPNARVDEVLGGRRILPESATLLAGSLPNHIVAAGARFASVPAALQQQITFAFGADILGDPIDPRTFAWAQLNNKQVTLSFRPATQADEDALRALLPAGDITDISQLPSSIPAYLIRVIPELKVEGTVVMSGAQMTLGTDLAFSFNPKFASSGVRPFSYNVPAGSYLAVAVFAGTISPAQIAETRARLAASRAALQSGGPLDQLTRERLLGDTFHGGLLGYYSQYLAIGSLSGLQQGGHHTLAAGIGSFGYEANVDSFFGIPRRVLPGGAAMNIPIVNAVAKDSASASGGREFTFQLGAVSSALEHAVPEQLFGPSISSGQAISAVKALSIANAAGQRVYHITPSNQSAVLPLIRHDAETMSEIRAALNAGKAVVTHTAAVAIPGWSGAGYVMLDTETGAAAWKITGGFNGSYLAGLFLGMMLSVLAVMVIASSGGLALPLLASVLLHATLFELIVAESGGGLDRSCFFAGLLAGLATLGLVLISFNGTREILGALLGMLGYSAAVLDLDGSRQDCGL